MLGEAFPRLAPDLPPLLRMESPGKRTRLTQLNRQLTSCNQEGLNRRYIALQDFRPFLDVEMMFAFAGRQPLLNALARVFEDFRVIPQTLGDGTVVGHASLLCQPMQIHNGEDGSTTAMPERSPLKPRRTAGKASSTAPPTPLPPAPPRLSRHQTASMIRLGRARRRGRRRGGG